MAPGQRHKPNEWLSETPNEYSISSLKFAKLSKVNIFFLFGILRRRFLIEKFRFDWISNWLWNLNETATLFQ